MAVIWKNRYASLSEPAPLFTVLIAAAGGGSRLGGVYKPLLPLCGKPALAYSFEAFEESGFVKRLVVSAPKERHDEILRVASACGCTKLALVTEGGETRTASVTKAFTAAFASGEDVTPFVAVHDAARPLITVENLNDVFFACVRYGAAAAATKVRDALKHTGRDQLIDADIDREGVWQIQTPQAFDTDIFHTALALAAKNGVETAVDDAALVTRAGFRVMCVETGQANFKITYPDDIKMAEAILASRTERRNP